MKVLLMSDSHGRNNMIDLVIDRHPDADLYLHCGDIECDEYTYPMLRVVCGNNDYFANFPDKIKLKLGNHNVLMFHSHQCRFRERNKFISQLAKQEGCDTVFFGHSHVACDMIVDGVRLINPGSLYYSRDGRPISYCLITIDDEMKVEHFFAPFV